jgi:excisionase family DNA binding protein
MERLDRLVSIDELADYLGVPVATLYAWRYRREGPPGFRVGRHVRYRWSDIQTWIASRLEDDGLLSVAPGTVRKRPNKPAAVATSSLEHRHKGSRSVES